MATGVNTIEVPFETMLTSVATNTTIGTATRHDFAAVTIHIPEASVTIRSVMLDVTARDEFGTGTYWPATMRLGIKLGAVAFNDQDDTDATSTTSDHETLRWTRDVTAYFVSNWTGTSMTSQVGIAISTAIARTYNNVTAKLIITYTYTEATTSGTAAIKTVRIPIQSHSGTLTTSHTEVGTDGTTPAPANQIPALDTFLPESSKVIRHAWLEINAHDSITGTTAINLFVKIDSATEVQGATLVQTLNSTTNFFWILTYDTTTFSTATVHSINMRSSLTTTFPSVGAVLCITYEYDPFTSTRILNSLLMPLDPASVSPRTAPLSFPNPDVYWIDLWVEEPGTITLLQSGVILHFDSNASAVLVKAESQSERAYTLGTVNALVGPSWYTHRADHSSGWTLARGKNTLKITFRSSGSSPTCAVGGVMIVNYTSDRALAGPHVHNHTTVWHGADFNGWSTVQRLISAAAQDAPILGSHYFINNASLLMIVRRAQAVDVPVIQTTRLAGEYTGDGFDTMTRFFDGAAELCTHPYYFNILPRHNQTDQSTGKMVLTTARILQTNVLGGSVRLDWLRRYVTHHEMKFGVSAQFFAFTGDGSGITVELWDQTDGRIVASTTTVIGGTYTITGYDNTHTYYVEGRQSGVLCGRSDDFTPVEIP